MSDYLFEYRRTLDGLREEGRLRSLRESDVLPGGMARFEGGVYVNFSGNDYLGVAGDAELRREFYELHREFPPVLASTGSRLLGGNTSAHVRLEATLEKLYGRPALVFNSGYHANIGILPALTGRDSMIFSDKLNHASIIDGLRLCEGEFKRYRHLDYGQLEQMLDGAKQAGRQAFIVSESIFSMDGDTADIAKLVELKKRYGALLVVDEAHAVGVTGRDGLGLCAGFGGDVDVIIGTFGKALGSAGAYCITHAVLRDYLINFMRPFIFSTALPPVCALWSDFVLNRLAGLEPRRRHLAELSAAVRAAVASSGFRTLGDSQIVPVIVGDNAPALELAERFRRAGMLAFAVRPPTVPLGTSRLRLSLNAAVDMDVAGRIGELLK